MRRHVFLIAALAALGPLAGPALAPAAAQTPADEEARLLATGNRLAELLRAGRAVVSAKQPLINDPDVAHKGLTPEAFVAEVAALHVERTGAPPITEAMDPAEAEIVQALLDAMAGAIAEAQPLIDREGMGFKGFIPATFARMTNERFGAIEAGAARMKVTAPPALVRNRTATPDAWERAVIEDHLGTPEWSHGETFYETVADGEGRAFRMLIPEYYADSCMSCHGGPAGETDITGFPKEGAAAGDLGGAISITLTR